MYQMDYWDVLFWQFHGGEGILIYRNLEFYTSIIMRFIFVVFFAEIAQLIC